MSNRIFVILSIIAACGIISAAYAQMFDIKPSDQKIVPGINKIPPLLPVLSPGDFQSKVKSLSEDNRTAMIQQGLNTIQQQRDTLPGVNPGEPPPLPPPTKTSDTDKNHSPTTATQTPAATQTSTPPTENTEQNATDTEETEENNTSNEPAPSNAGSAGGNSPTPKVPPRQAVQG